MSKRGKGKQPSERNGKLRIPLPFDDAIRAALETAPKPLKQKPARKTKRR